MQTKIIDYNFETKNKNKNLRLFIIGFFILFLSIFSAKFIFAEVLLSFDKENYIVMEDKSTLVGFTITNTSDSKVNLLVQAECDNKRLECNYSQEIKLPEGVSSYSSFFNIYGLDDSRTYLSMIVKDLKTNQIKTFETRIEVIDDIDEGLFEIDVYNSVLCIGKTNRVTFEIYNNSLNDFYNLHLTSDILNITQDLQNPVYLNNKKEIDYFIFVPETTDEKSYDVRYLIENNRVKETKSIILHTRKCVDSYVNFSVSGLANTTYYLNKAEEITIKYKVTNNSSSTKTIFISEEQAEENFDVSIDKRELKVERNLSKEVEINIKPNKDIKSGYYDITLYFFDGVSVITKKVRIYIIPEYSISTESLTNLNQTLVIGRNKEIELLINNKGDLKEDFTISVTVGNDIRVINPGLITVNENSTRYLPILFSAGERTQTINTQMIIEIFGKNSNFYKKYIYSIDIVRDQPTTTLSFLSYPKTIEVTPNSTQEIDFIIRNIGLEKIIIDRVEIVNVSQEITIQTLRNIIIDPEETKTITVTLNIADLKQVEDAKIRFVTDTGVVLEKAIAVKLPELNKQEQEKAKITGFLNLKSSLFYGVVIFCLLIILLFVFGIFKSNKI